MTQAERLRALACAFGCRLRMGLYAIGFAASALAVCGQTELEPNNTPAGATPLDLSSGFASIASAIGSPGDVDFFSFTAPAGSRAWILVDTGGAAAPEADSTDSFLALLGSNGMTVIEDDDDDGSGNGSDSTEESGFASAIAGRTLMNGGTYFIRVNDFGDDGVISPYRLLVVLTTTDPTTELEPNGSILGPNALIEAGQSAGLRSGTIGQPGDVDYYSVHLNAGDTVLISADCDPEHIGFSSDLELSLLGPDRVTVLYTADSSADDGRSAESFVYKVAGQGTYYLKVTQVDGGTGIYDLLAATQPPSSFQFTAGAYQVLEGVGVCSITVERAGNASGLATVSYATADGSAVAPADYQAATGVLTFGEGVTSQTFNLSIAPDTFPEANEYLNLVLSMPTGGAVLGALSQAVLTILDDDETPNDTPAAATPLAFRSGFATVTDLPGTGLPAISPSGDTDWYSFEAPPMSRVWVLVDTGGPQSPGGTSRDSHIALFASDGQTLLEEDDDDGVGNGSGGTIDSEGHLASAISGRLLKDGGRYYLVVQAFDAEAVINPYRLHVLLSSEMALSESPDNDAPENAEAVLADHTRCAHRLAQIHPAGDADWFQIRMPQDGFLWAAIDADPYREDLSTDVVLDVISPDGQTVLLSVDSSGSVGEAAESVVYQVETAGIYYVRVRHYLGSETGPYGLTLARWPGDLEPNDTAASAIPLVLSRGMASAAGSIAFVGDVDLYSLNASAASRLWVTVDGATADPPPELVVSVLAGDGTTVIETDSQMPGGAAIAGCLLVAGGSYYLRVQAMNAEALVGQYRLTVSLTTDSPVAEQEDNGSVAAAAPLLSTLATSGLRHATLSSVSDNDFYSVSLPAGGLLMVCADADPERDGIGTDLRLELIGPDGSTVLAERDSSAVGSLGDPAAEGMCYRVGAAGRYFLRVTSVRGGTGTYMILAAKDSVPLTISSRQVVGQDMRVGFYGLAGMNYCLQHASAVTGAPIWTSVSSAVAGLDGIVHATHVGGATLPQGFYRVIQVP